MTSSIPQSSTTPEREQIQRESRARAVDQSVMLALHLATEAGWADVADVLGRLKVVTDMRWRAVLEQA